MGIQVPGVGLTQPDELVDHVRSFLDCGLMLDPWLGDLAEERIEPEAQGLVRNVAENLSGRYWREPYIGVTEATVPATRGIGFTAAFNVLTCTAALIAHDRVGHVAVTQTMAEEARRRLEGFIGRRGFRALVWVYLTISRFEHLRALEYYHGMPKDDFIRGRHRGPWVQAPLDMELRHGVADDDFQITNREGRRWVEQTPLGRQHFEVARKVLGEAGFFEARVRIALFSELNLMRDFDATVRRMIPREVEWRRSVTAFVGPRHGLRVLEVGCGTGTQIFEGGLREAVGPSGRVAGLDPAVGLLEQAQAKVDREQARNVKLVQGFAEEMPFRDGEFDITLGVAVLHMTDVRRALAEMARVTRPGGTVAHIGACELEDPPKWFSEWLAPVFAHSSGNAARHPHAPPGRGEVAQWFAAAGLVDVQSQIEDVPAIFDDPDRTAIVVLHIDPVVQDVLGSLPWAAAQELMQEITQRARLIFPRLSAAERRVLIPFESVRGRVPAAGIS